jgi:hypothetical protein
MKTDILSIYGGDSAGQGTTWRNAAILLLFQADWIGQSLSHRYSSSGLLDYHSFWVVVNKISRQKFLLLQDSRLQVKRKNISFYSKIISKIFRTQFSEALNL